MIRERFAREKPLAGKKISCCLHITTETANLMRTLKEGGAEHIAKNANTMEKKVYVLPKELDNEIAQIKLESMGMNIDALTEEQVKYLSSWQSGT